jgi:U6 snRNA-associated Sm-like protein LSm4
LVYDVVDAKLMSLQLVELKNGETFNGHLVNCDNFMNITLREVYQTNSDGDRFWKLKECYIRGSTVRLIPCDCRSTDDEMCFQIKYLRVPDTLLDTVKDEQARARESSRGGRGGHPGGGRGTDLLVFHLILHLLINDAYRTGSSS